MRTEASKKPCLIGIAGPSCAGKTELARHVDQLACGAGACLRRRIERDVRERGRTPESVLEHYRTTVEPMARRYVLPTAAFAGLVLDGEARIEESVAAALAVIRGAR